MSETPCCQCRPCVVFRRVGVVLLFAPLAIALSVLLGVVVGIADAFAKVGYPAIADAWHGRTPR